MSLGNPATVSWTLKTTLKICRTPTKKILNRLNFLELFIHHFQGCRYHLNLVHLPGIIWHLQWMTETSWMATQSHRKGLSWQLLLDLWMLFDHFWTWYLAHKALFVTSTEPPSLTYGHPKKLQDHLWQRQKTLSNTSQPPAKILLANWLSAPNWNNVQISSNVFCDATSLPCCRWVNFLLNLNLTRKDPL